jgi:hypothetical protein
VANEVRGTCCHWEGTSLGTFPHHTCDDKMRSIQDFHMDQRGWSDIAYCVDEQTEILTIEGWKAFDELSVADPVLTLNHATGQSEWQPVLAVCVFAAPPRGRDMILMEGSQHSSLSTPNHRWPVERTAVLSDPKPDVRSDRLFETTETLGCWDRIPVAAPCADLPTAPKFSDAMVELVARFWTCPNGHKEEFWLSADAGKELVALAPDRAPSLEFLLSLTRAQLSLFITVSMLADNSGAWSLAQKSKKGAEAFQLAAILAGYGTSLRPRRPTRSTPYEMWEVRLRRKTHFSPGPAKNAEGRFAVQRETYAGKVWCPRTPNQTWLARRKGTVYFTGNSFVACPHGYVFEGRGWGVRTAAQGTTFGNDHYHAACHLGGAGDPFGDPARHAMRDVFDEAGRRYPRGIEIRPHSYFRATECPGDAIRAWVAAGAPRPGVPPAPSPEEDDDMPKLELIGAVEREDVYATNWATKWHVPDETVMGHLRNLGVLVSPEVRIIPLAVFDRIPTVRADEPFP